MTSWREKCSPIIAEKIKEGIASGMDEKAVKKHVSKAYPFGERIYYPYKIWLDEIKKQLAFVFHKATYTNKRLVMNRAESSGQVELLSIEKWNELQKERRSHDSN